MASLSRKKSVVAALLLLPLASTEDISLAALRAAKYSTQEAIGPVSSDVYALLATLQHNPHTAEAEDAARGEKDEGGGGGEDAFDDDFLRGVRVNVNDRKRGDGAE